MRPVALDRGPEVAGDVELGGGGCAQASSTPRQSRLRRPGPYQQDAAGGIEDIGESLDHPLAERRPAAPGATQRGGEAQPFGAIIVAVLEQMLGEFDLGPAARAGARQQHHGADGHHRQQRDQQAAHQSQPVPRNAVARTVITAK